jgi:hypothetical protein
VSGEVAYCTGEREDEKIGLNGLVATVDSGVIHSEGLFNPITGGSCNPRACI